MRPFIKMEGNVLDLHQYRIKKIKEKKIQNGKTLYLVSWENFGQGKESWIQAEYINQDLIREFEISNANMNELCKKVEGLNLKSILNIVEIDSETYFLVELDSGKSYVPQKILEKVASKQLRDFLVEYYTRLSIYCSSF